MFTGIIKSIGKIISITQNGTNKTFKVASELSSEFHADQSVSHDGVCLTIESCDDKTHTVTMIAETLGRSNLGTKMVGDFLNIEPCIRLNDALDGHIVQGHVDTVTTCLEISEQNGSWNIRFKLEDQFKGLVVEKGSICINGVSLTISHLNENSFGVSIIPYTYRHTNFKLLRPGSFVNIEFDILGKYVSRILNLKKNT